MGKHDYSDSTAVAVVGPGYFSSTRRCILALRLIFVRRITSSLLLRLPTAYQYISFSFVCSFLYLFLTSLSLIFFVCFFVFICSLSVCQGSWRTYVVPDIAQCMALYYDVLLSTT